MRFIEKIILVVYILLLVLLAIMIVNPWCKHQQYTFCYIREKAVELAKTIEHKQTVRLSINCFSRDMVLIISIVKPNEEPILSLIHI